MKTIDEEGYKYLEILQYDKVKEKEMKMEFARKYKRRLRLLFLNRGFMSGFWRSEKDFKKSLNEKEVENWKEKQMYGQFIWDMPEGTDKEKS